MFHPVITSTSHQMQIYEHLQSSFFFFNLNRIIESCENVEIDKPEIVSSFASLWYLRDLKLIEEK